MIVDHCQKSGKCHGGHFRRENLKTQFTDPDYAKKVALLQQQSLNIFQPAILYTKPKTKIEEKSDILKDRYQKIKVPIDHEDPNSQTTEWKVPLFENGTPEEFIKWKISFDELIKALDQNTTAQKHELTILSAN